AQTFGPDNKVRTIATAIDQDGEGLQCAAHRIDYHLRTVEMVSTATGLSQKARDSYDAQKLINTLWDQVFPYWFPFGTDLVLVVLDSNATSTNLVTNGFGEISQTQLKKLEEVGRMFPDSRMLIAMHHHPVDPPIRAAVQKFLSLTNSRDFF